MSVRFASGLSLGPGRGMLLSHVLGSNYVAAHSIKNEVLMLVAFVKSQKHWEMGLDTVLGKQ